MRHFRHDPQLGAVTGNPRIRNRSTLLGRLQVGEFSMIIGLIKRAQSLLGGLFCVSGVIGCFRRSALHAVGYWNPERLTEDIDVTWQLQRRGWHVRYEPHALIWILMPETLQGLWRQRLRWAEGGLQVLRANLDLLWTPRQWQLLPLLLEPLASLTWAFGLAGLLLLAALQGLVALLRLPLGFLPQAWLAGASPTGALHVLHPPRGEGDLMDGAMTLSALLPHGLASLLLITCAVQFAVSLWLDRPYDRGLGRIAFWMIWYPAAYWLLTFLATLTASWLMVRRPHRGKARWVSPDRGLGG